MLGAFSAAIATFINQSIITISFICTANLVIFIVEPKPTSVQDASTVYEHPSEYPHQVICPNKSRVCYCESWASFRAYQILHLQRLYERLPCGELDPAVSGRPAVGVLCQLQFLDLRHTERDSNVVNWPAAAQTRYTWRTVSKKQGREARQNGNLYQQQSTR